MLPGVVVLRESEGRHRARPTRRRASAPRSGSAAHKISIILRHEWSTFVYGQQDRCTVLSVWPVLTLGQNLL